MKYYILNSEGKEVSFDISQTIKTEDNKYNFHVSKESSKTSYFIKTVVGKSYISKDKKNWEKVPEISGFKGLVNTHQNLNIYRGFKPSGLSNAGAGTLITDMPGKVVKVLTTEGAMVHEGDTLLILEAMKMENEIKSPLDGVIKSVNVKVGDTLESGQLMIEIDD